MKRKCFRDFDIVSGPTWQPPPVLSGCERGADFGGQFGPPTRPGGIHFLQFSDTFIVPTLDMNIEIFVTILEAYALSRFLRRAAQYPLICLCQNM